jgi:hypothetical protein
MAWVGFESSYPHQIDVALVEDLFGSARDLLAPTFAFVLGQGLESWRKEARRGEFSTR